MVIISALKFKEFYSPTHRMKPVPPIHTGLYLNSPSRNEPPKELTEAMGMPIPPALAIKELHKLIRA